jgi:carnitine O-acetyltransferase
VSRGRPHLCSTADPVRSQLERIVANAGAPESKPVGALTSDNRDKWAAARDALLAVGNGGGEKNKAALARIESSVIVLALDADSPTTIEEVSPRPSSRALPPNMLTLLQRSWALWWGDGKNRFYDKQQLVVSANGKSGYMGEHSTMDGTPTLRMNDFVLSALAANKIDLGSGSRSLPTPKAIEFALDANVEGRIADSIKAFEELKAKHDLAVLDFQGYGKGAIKKYKCSPDAWVQMAIQLAFYKMYGAPCATYESAQTRKFKFGRTEVIRSCSVESKAFCEAMESSSASDEERSQAFQAAVKQHLAYAKDAADAQGVDRHLFGLKKLLKDGEQLPALYQDEAFAKSSHWKLSTSQISSESFAAWGYGEVVPDGFGCAYAVSAEQSTPTFAEAHTFATDQGELAHVHAHVAQARRQPPAPLHQREHQRAARAARPPRCGPEQAVERRAPRHMYIVLHLCHATK